MFSALLQRFEADLSDVSQEPGLLRATVERGSLRRVCEFCRNDNALRCDYLSCIFGRDAGDAIDVVYDVYSLEFGHRILLRVVAPKDSCWLPSVTSIWKAADWHERETAEMFGVEFRDHPNPRHLLLPEDWRGFPLRKDYVPEPDYTRPDELPEGVWDELRERVEHDY